jgi:membrane fusion protein (multidrug efflux system)
VRLKIDEDENVIVRTGMSASVSVDTGKERGLPTFLSFLGTANAAK